MHVSRKLLWRKYQRNRQNDRQANNQNQKLETLQSMQKVSKIKQAIKNIIIETVKTIGKTLTSAILTSVIVIVTDLINYANSTRPQFAIGGEWLMILFIFIGWMFVIDWILGKKRKPLTTK